MAQRKFAVFDIDGTLVRTGLFAQVVDQLIADNHLPADSRARLDEKREFAVTMKPIKNMSTKWLMCCLKTFIS